jgi:Zn finger protein HypA/HybF involved in hydrogenase expression
LLQLEEVVVTTIELPQEDQNLIVAIDLPHTESIEMEAETDVIEVIGEMTDAMTEEILLDVMIEETTEETIGEMTEIVIDIVRETLEIEEADQDLIERKERLRTKRKTCPPRL